MRHLPGRVTLSTDVALALQQCCRVEKPWIGVESKMRNKRVAEPEVVCYRYRSPFTDELFCHSLQTRRLGLFNELWQPLL